MSDLGPNLGIQFTETASGYVAARISDPVVAERLAKDEGGAFRLALQISIPRLQGLPGFLVRIAVISGGSVSWKPDLSDAPVLPGGRVTLSATPIQRAHISSSTTPFRFPRGKVVSSLVAG